MPASHDTDGASSPASSSATATGTSTVASRTATNPIRASPPVTTSSRKKIAVPTRRPKGTAASTSSPVRPCRTDGVSLSISSRLPLPGARDAPALRRPVLDPTVAEENL
ncbi:hypothetical protein [Amycolatopsis sp. La24]|uniref:hypothetical protein n=1 Tax=Amycolatopsis sp. La24 TaxID=3028304 RepID=UPI0023AE88A6|nr:hypothetical protein [Amycolatopsis sp. La24]